MASDDRIPTVLASVAAPRERFRSAVVGAVEEVRAFLEAHRPAPEGAVTERSALELGTFAGGRIDPDRFGAVFAAGAPLDALSLSRIEAALHELSTVAAAGETLHRAHVPPHVDLHLVVAHALASAGRVFAAAQVVELIRTGRWSAAEHASLLQPFPFRRWNRAERAIAPPLVVEVDGPALQAGGLAEFMDGTQKVVLVVRGACPPAPLARLITPRVMVLQTGDPAELERVGAFDGPAVAALMPAGAASFVHDPSAAQRLDVRHVPGDGDVRSLEGYSAFAQREELALLRLLASPPAADAPQPAAASGEPAAAPAEAPGDPVDTLAGWLLRQAGLDGAGPGS
jgi:hypothetical protein